MPLASVHNYLQNIRDVALYICAMGVLVFAVIIIDPLAQSSKMSPLAKSLLIWGLKILVVVVSLIAVGIIVSSVFQYLGSQGMAMDLCSDNKPWCGIKENVLANYLLAIVIFGVVATVLYFY